LTRGSLLAETHKPSTLTRRLAAIAKQHRNAGFESPASMKYSAVHNVIAGIRREIGTRPDAKRALATDELRRMVTAIPATPHGLRDRALLLIGYAGGFRRSELAAITLEHVEDTPDGLKILIPRSKTDQEGEGRLIGIPYGSVRGPVRCVRTAHGSRQRASPKARSSGTSTTARWARKPSPIAWWR
jgi:integrase